MAKDVGQWLCTWSTKQAHGSRVRDTGTGHARGRPSGFPPLFAFLLGVIFFFLCFQEWEMVDARARRQQGDDGVLTRTAR